MTVDTSRNQLLVYGGSFYYGIGGNAFTSANAFGGSGEDCGQRPALIEVWALDKDKYQWNKRSSAGVQFFQERTWACGSYSLASDAMIVIGGMQGGFGCAERYRPAYGTYLGSIAAFSLRTGKWSEYSVPVDLARIRMGGAYVPERGEFVVFGGSSREANDTDEVVSATGYIVQTELQPRVYCNGSAVSERGGGTMIIEFDQPVPAIENLRLCNMEAKTAAPLNGVINRAGPSTFVVRMAKGTRELLNADVGLRVAGNFADEALGFLGSVVDRRRNGRAIGKQAIERDTGLIQGSGEGLPSAEATAVGDAYGGVRLALEGFRPNPFSSTGRIVFSLSDGRPARLQLIDVRGRIVSDEEVGFLGAGHHSVSVSRGTSVAAGMYWIRLIHPERTLTVRGVVAR